LDDPYEIRRIAEAFTKQIGTETWLDILHAHSRCKRIVRDLDETFDLNPDVDPDASSKALHEATEAAWHKMDAAEDKLTTLLDVMAELREPINVFFDVVMVMAKEPELKAARLALVQRIAALPSGIVDLSQFEGF
jgi:glycyl-tRNA synthetase beta subunit